MSTTLLRVTGALHGDESSLLRPVSLDYLEKNILSSRAPDHVDSIIENDERIAKIFKIREIS